MKTILLADSEIISYYKGDRIEWFNTQNYSIAEILCHIEDEKPQAVFIYNELKLKNEPSRSKHNGLDLIKHIRLTPLKDNLHNLPIVLLHWLPIEHYIEKNLENLILFSSGIKRVRLPFTNSDFDVPARLSENITPFLFHSESDEKISEHQFRNEIAISQFEAELTSGKSILKDKPIWYKKLYYQQGYTSVNIDETIVNSQLRVRLLLIDDLGDKWKAALLKVLPNATIEVCKNLSEVEAKIDEVQKQIKERRSDFSGKASKQSEILSEINDKQIELKDVSDKLTAEKNKLSTTQNNKSTVENEIKENDTKLRELLNELTKDGGIIEALIDYKAQDINTDTQKGISSLSLYITNISNAKKILINSEQVINTCNQAIANLSKQKSDKENELQALKLSYQTVSNELNKLFESLCNSEIDLILLDMHLTKESEGKEYKQMDGYKVLSKLRSVSLKIPVMVFSATQKDLTNLLSEFNFLQRTTFLKGMTPVSTFVNSINDLETKAAGNRLISILDEVIVFPSYKYREYESYNAPQYEAKDITPTNKSSIGSQLLLIQSDLKNYLENKNVSYLTSIVLKLGNILREYRFKVQSNAIDKKNSLFHNSNAANRINSSITDLMFYRNKTEHRAIYQAEISRYNKWLEKLDLKEIEKYLKIVYEGLIFDK